MMDRPAEPVGERMSVTGCWRAQTRARADSIQTSLRVVRSAGDTLSLALTPVGAEARVVRLPETLPRPIGKTFPRTIDLDASLQRQLERLVKASAPSLPKADTSIRRRQFPRPRAGRIGANWAPIGRPKTERATTPPPQHVAKQGVRTSGVVVRPVL